MANASAGTGSRLRVRGFTLIELLVVVTIVGVLVALLLPAVQAAREAARRVHCANNLKQVALAMNGYHADHNVFPPGDLGGWTGWSAQARLLPYLEQAPLFNAINFAFGNRVKDGRPAINATVVGTRLAQFLCPSAPAPSGTLTFFPPGVLRPGNSYFASMGPSLNFWGTLASSRPTGMFSGDGPAIGLGDVLDGSSATILLGEWRMGDWDPDRLTSNQDVIGMGDVGPNGETNPWDSATMSMPRGDVGGAFRAWLRRIDPAARASVGNPNLNRSWLGEMWASGLPGLGMGNTLLPPNSPYGNAQVQDGAEDFDTPGIFGLSSHHPGGAHVAMADGSARFLKASTDMSVVWALGTRGQGEIVSADAF